MARVRLPLYGKILLWFLVNLLVLALLFAAFMSAQFRLGLDWMLSGEPGDRIAAMGDSVTYEFSRLPESDWNARLTELGRANGVSFALFDNTGRQAYGQTLEVPVEVQRKLIDRRDPREGPPPRRPTGPAGKRPADAPPKPRFMQRAGTPANYWAGVHLDLVDAKSSRALTLVMMSSTLTGGGLFFDLWPWMGLLAAGLLISALIWMPFVRGITGFIGVLNNAAGRIAHGKFEERITRERSDELGELSTSVNAMAAQLGDYVAQQRRITADVAHELCSPIARMQMALGIVEQRGTPEQATYLKKIDAELQHMARLVEEVLAFSKAETLPDRESPEEVPLNELLTAIIAREAADVEVQLEAPPTLTVHSLRNALDRAVGNVLRNAVRYASHAGPIHVNATQSEGRTMLSIRDEGPGVPPDSLPRLFEPFYRPEAARGRNTGGSGLGLAIARRCIEACGGSVNARNVPGGGFEVTFVI